MNQINKKLFENKNWGTDSVLKDTLLDLKDDKVALLSEKNDIDLYEDIESIAIFNQFLETSKLT